MLSRGKIVAFAGPVLAFAGGLLAGGAAWGLTAGFALVVAVAVVGWSGAARADSRAEKQIRELRKAVSREEILGGLGTSLLSATGAAEVHRHAALAAAALLRDYPGARAAVVSEGEQLPPVAERRLRLLQPPPPELPEAHAETTVTLPLRAGGRSLGVLTVSAPEPLPADLLGALQAVRTQAALALDNVHLSAAVVHGATCDALTGLGNRALVRDRLTAALARSRRNGRSVGVLMLDLGGLRQVNDVHGHDAGDELLRFVAERVQESVRTEDTVGRLGGDRFAVIAEDLHTARDVVVIAERIVASLDRSVPVGGRMLRAPASVGIALSHPDTEGPDEVLRAAESAMSAAKRRGGDRYQLHGAPALA